MCACVCHFIAQEVFIPRPLSVGVREPQLVVQQMRHWMNSSTYEPTKKKKKTRAGNGGALLCVGSFVTLDRMSCIFSVVFELEAVAFRRKSRLFSTAIVGLSV